MVSFKNLFLLPLAATAALSATIPGTTSETKQELESRAFSNPNGIRLVYGAVTLVIRNFIPENIGDIISQNQVVQLGAVIQSAWTDGTLQGTLAQGGQDIASAVLTPSTLVDNDHALLPPQIVGQAVIEALGYAVQSNVGQAAFELYDLAGNQICAIIAGAD